MPVLFEANREVIEVYSIVQTQLITSFNGAVAIDVNAIETVMKYLDVKDRKNVFFKVYDLGNHMIRKMKETE